MFDDGIWFLSSRGPATFDTLSKSFVVHPLYAAWAGLYGFVRVNVGNPRGTSRERVGGSILLGPHRKNRLNDSRSGSPWATVKRDVDRVVGPVRIIDCGGNTHYRLQ